MAGFFHPLRLVADVGGTNARFSLLDEKGRPSRIRTFACAGYPDIESAIRNYLSEESDGLSLDEAVIAIANPVTGDWVRMTNHHWAFSVQMLKRALGLKSLLIVNDFAALAMALPALPSGDLKQIGGEGAVSGEPIGVIGPGTGLGVAGLIRAGESWQPLAGEGGHVTLAPANDLESEILAVLRKRFGHVSAERVLSGPGIVALREALGVLRNRTPGVASPAEIAGHAVKGGDELCSETISVFCAMLGTVAGNLALTLGARGGIYLGGGILPQLGDFFHRSQFRSRFEDKGRFASYLAAIPCYVIQAEYPALIGASRYFESCDGGSA